MDITKPNVKYYDINWDKVKTIKDLKAIVRVLATKLQINHNDPNDIEVFNSLEYLLVESDYEQIN